MINVQSFTKKYLEIELRNDTYHKMIEDLLGKSININLHVPK